MAAKWVRALAISVVLAVGAALPGCEAGTSPTVSDSGSGASRSTSPSTSTQTAGAGGGPDAPAESWFAATYGEFPTEYHSGKGDGTVVLPQRMAGLARLRFTSGTEFKFREPGGPWLVDATGPYEGTVPVGVLGYAVVPGSLQIRSDGPWDLRLTPVSTAPVLTTAARGRGDAVYLYNGEATSWTVTHSGSITLWGARRTPDGNDMALVELDARTRRARAAAGPYVVVIRADSDWAITVGSPTSVPSTAS